MTSIDQKQGGMRAAPYSARHKIRTTTSGASDGRIPLLVMLYLIAVILPMSMNVGPLYMTGLRAYLLALMVPLTLMLLSGRAGRLIWTDFLFFLHIVWMSAAIAINNPNMVLQNTGAAALEFLGGYLIGRIYIRSRADFIALCRWLGFLVCLTLPLAIFETLTGIPPLIRIINMLPVIDSLPVSHTDPRLGLERVQVFLAHPIHYGLFASSAFSLTVVALKGIISDGQRWLLGASIGLSVFLSLSSGALVPMVMQIGLIVWITLFRSIDHPWRVLVILVALTYAVVEVLSNRSAVMVFFSYAAFSNHNAYWRAIIFEWGMINVWSNPFFGLGFNEWVRPSFMHSGSMDNFWLVQAVRYGIPGFLLIALGYGIGMLRVGLRDFRKDPILAQLRRAWIFTFVGLTLTLCTVHIWSTVYSFVFFLFGAGMWFISADASEKRETHVVPSGREPLLYTRFPIRPRLQTLSSFTREP